MKVKYKGGPCDGNLVTVATDRTRMLRLVDGEMHKDYKLLPEPNNEGLRIAVYDPEGDPCARKRKDKETH
jgi:hypothetical protein